MSNAIRLDLLEAILNREGACISSEDVPLLMKVIWDEAVGEEASLREALEAIAEPDILVEESGGAFLKQALARRQRIARHALGLEDSDEETGLKTYIVEVREIHVQKVRVKAESEDHAKELISQGDGDYIDNALEYSDSLEPDTWVVYEED
jgi:hypothetical protein